MSALTVDQKKWLDWIRERGGSGVLDRYGRLMAGGERTPQGAQISLLFLVAKGYLRGHENRLYLNDSDPFIELREAICEWKRVVFKGVGPETAACWTRVRAAINATKAPGEPDEPLPAT